MAKKLVPGNDAVIVNEDGSLQVHLDAANTQKSVKAQETARVAEEAQNILYKTSIISAQSKHPIRRSE